MRILTALNKIEGIQKYTIIICSFLANLLMLAAGVILKNPDKSLDMIFMSRGIFNVGVNIFSAGFIGGILFDIIQKR